MMLHTTNKSAQCAGQPPTPPSHTLTMGRAGPPLALHWSSVPTALTYLLTSTSPK